MSAQAMQSMEELLRAGQPLSALRMYVSHESSPSPQQQAALLFLTEEQAAALQRRVYDVVLTSYHDPKVLASGVILLGLCKLPTWPLKVDVAVLMRIEQGGLVEEDALEGMTVKLASAEPGSASETTRAAVEEVAKVLAETILSVESSWLSSLNSADAKTKLRQRGMRDWALLRAFCEQHGLDADASRMLYLAAENDWVHFLAEASTHTHSYQQVVRAALEHIAGGTLRHHILHVLSRMAPDDAQAPLLPSSAFQKSKGGLHVELLDLLAHVELAHNPSGALLAAAEERRWPILALLAASYGCPSLNCMAVWLRATLPCVTASAGDRGNREAGAVDGEQSKADGVEAYRRAAGAALQAACRQGAFKEAIEAVQLFLPGCPLIGCLRFLQCGAGCRYREMEAHLEGLTRSMTPPPARRPGSAEGETEAAWVMNVTWAVTDNQLAAAAGASERAALLQRITSLDLPVPGGSGSARYGLLHLLYELLGSEGEPFVLWPQQNTGPAREQLPTYTDSGAALAHMLAQHDWQSARRWAAATGEQLHQVTLAQATALLEDWQALAWGEGLRGGAWRDIHALFAAEQLPPLLAARFLVEHAKRLAAEGALTPREQFHLLKEALEWLVEGGCGCELELERGLAGALGRGLQLLSARLQLAGQPAPQPAGPLVAPWAAASSEEEPDQEPPLAERGAPTGGARAAAASRQAHSDDADAGGDWRQPAAEATLAALQDILGSPGPKEITAAVRAQLEQGDVAGARSLSRELASPPIEVVLVEAAVAVIRLCRPPGSAEAGQHVAAVVPAAVISFLRRRGHTALGTAQEVLEALQACAGRGAARPVCSLAAASFRAATALGMTCAEAARLAPRESLQILLMRGPQAAPMAIEYAAAYQMSVEQTAEVLADAYIKGLLWAHHDAHGESPAAWTPAEFVSCTEGLGAPRRLGSALLAVLLERHGALPPGVEAGLLLAAHAAYEAGGAADAMDALVQLAARAARAWAASGDWQPLVQLVAGLGQYQAVRSGMDLLVRADHLELLLSKRAGSGASADIGVRLWRAAVLAAIQRQRPGDAEALSIAYHHFACTREMAAGLHACAQDKALSGLNGGAQHLQDSLAHLDAMASALAAARAFSDAECGFAAAEAARTAILLGQKIQSPSR